MKTRINILLATLSAFLVVGCSSLGINTEEILPDKTVDYKKERSAGRNLEIPPDLTSSTINDSLPIPDAGPDGSATYSEYAGRGAGAASASGLTYSSATVLPSVQGVRVLRDGDDRWLLVGSTPQDVWPQVVDFWQDNGILLVEQDPVVGIMRTAWIENRADISRGFITDTIRSVFEGIYDAGTRDQYRVRLEEGPQPGTTEVYMTHFGMEEELVGEDTSGGPENSVWQPRGRDAGLEAEMLRRLMIHFGIENQRARTALNQAQEERRLRSQLIKGQEGVSLLVSESFSPAWRVTGLALDRVGFAVEDRDRSQGIYYVRYADPTDGQAEEGWLSKLAFWESDEKAREARYEVQLREGGRGTTVTVHNEQGQRLQTATAERILTLLHEQIR